MEIEIPDKSTWIMTVTGEKTIEELSEINLVFGHEYLFANFSHLLT